MYRLIPVAALASLMLAAAAHAETCTVAGTAYDTAGRPLRDAVVRLFAADTGRASYAVTDANAAFQLVADNGNHTWRVDLLSHPTVVTGSHIPTRSILGMSPTFACRGSERQDVRALTE